MDGMHFSSASIHTGQSVNLDTDARNDIPISSFWNRLCVHHGLQVQVCHPSKSHDKNTISYEDAHKGLINILPLNVCTSLPCSVL